MNGETTMKMLLAIALLLVSPAYALVNADQNCSGTVGTAPQLLFSGARYTKGFIIEVTVGAVAFSPFTTSPAIGDNASFELNSVPTTKSTSFVSPPNLPTGTDIYISGTAASKFKCWVW